MSRETLILLLGIVVLLLPGSGFPEDWITYALRGAGILIILLGFLLRRAAYYRRIDSGSDTAGSETFVEGRHDVGRDTGQAET